MHALQEHNGMTLVLARLQALHHEASPSTNNMPTIGQFKAVVDANVWQEASWWDSLFFEVCATPHRAPRHATRHAAPLAPRATGGDVGQREEPSKGEARCGRLAVSHSRTHARFV